LLLLFGKFLFDEKSLHTFGCFSLSGPEPGETWGSEVVHEGVIVGLKTNKS
jgi:hypothetical protein